MHHIEKLLKGPVHALRNTQRDHLILMVYAKISKSFILSIIILMYFLCVVIVVTSLL